MELWAFRRCFYLESLMSELTCPIAEYISWLHPTPDRPVNFCGLTDHMNGRTKHPMRAIEDIRSLKDHPANRTIWCNVHRLKADAAAAKIKAEDVDAYQFFAIDIDADTGDAGKVSATDAEHAETLTIARRVIEAFRDKLPTPLLVSSGNGHLLLYPIDLPNSPENASRINRLLHAVQTAFDPQRRFIDVSVGNPDRVFGVVGTINRNKREVPEAGRVHRLRKVVGEYPDRTPMDADSFILWADAYTGSTERPTVETTGVPPVVSPTVIADSGKLRAASAYLAKVPGAIEGQKGDSHTFQTAGQLLAFGLTVDQVHTLMLNEWNGRCSPPWDAGELMVKVRSAASNGTPRAPKVVNVKAKHELKGQTGDVGWDDEPKEADAKTESYPMTDLGNAEHFIASVGQNIRYVSKWKSWIVWNGKNWCRDDRLKVKELVMKHVRKTMPKYAATINDLEARQKYFGWIAKSQSDQRINAILNLASAKVSILPDDLDRDGNLLNVANGTIELDTQRFREHRRDDLLTKICNAAYDPNATAPLWAKFIDRIFQDEQGTPRVDIIRYAQQIAGYSMTADVSEQSFFVLHGNGRNGKTTFVGAIKHVLGDYAMTGMNTLLLKSGMNAGMNSDDAAELFGCRLASVVETDEGVRLDEGKVKRLVDTDRLKVMRKYEQAFEFEPSHKLWLLCNHKPKIKGNDDGIWRRVKLIPFKVQIPQTERDGQLREKLAAEASGILNWMLAGLAGWIAGGRKLVDPMEVSKATGEYRTDSDDFGGFIGECLVNNDAAKVSVASAYIAYTNWADDNGINFKMTKIEFGKRMNERGYTSKPSNGIRYFIGCSLQTNDSLATVEAEQTATADDRPW